MGSSLMNCINDRLARRIGVWMGLAFLFLYLYSVENVVIAPGVDLAYSRPIPSASIAPDWNDKIWKRIAPFVWEPVAAFYPVRSVAFFVSVPNLFLGLFLGTLVGLNMTVAVATARILAPTERRRGILSGLFASFPALLTGFTCCVPTIVLALGSLAAMFTLAAITMAPYFLPAAVLALTGNLLWRVRKFSCALPPAQNQNRSNALIHKRLLKTKEG